MQIGEAARTSAAEIWSHKLRSGLTLVGQMLDIGGAAGRVRV